MQFSRQTKNQQTELRIIMEVIMGYCRNGRANYTHVPIPARVSISGSAIFSQLGKEKPIHLSYLTPYFSSVKKGSFAV